MKFELEPSARGVPNKELLADLVQVALLLKQNSVTKEEYNEHGKYNSSTLTRRFKCSWPKILEAANLQKTRTEMNVPSAKLLDDLRRVAARLGKDAVTRDEYDDHGEFATSTLSKRFGGWLEALEVAGLKRTRNLGITAEEFFQNLEEVWIKLGRQPRYAEMHYPLSKYSGSAYEDRFGSWRKALEAFVEYVNGGESQTNETKRAEEEVAGTAAVEFDKDKQFKHKTKRHISNRLKVRVLMKYGPTCQICFKTRKDYPNLDIVFDHIKPWIKGGETELENLQPLCRECNGGKGDLGQSESPPLN